MRSRAFLLLGLAPLWIIACGSSDEAVQAPGNGSGRGGSTGSGSRSGSSGSGSTSGGGATSGGGTSGTAGAAGEGAAGSGALPTAGNGGMGAGATGLPEVCGNGLDDDGDGLVDGGCKCTPGTSQPCYIGPAGTMGKGKCKAGTQVCEGAGEFIQWSLCEGVVAPVAEVCDDGADDDCDGTPDNGCVTCKPVMEMCNNGIDDDCDGSIDEDCKACTPTGKEICNNGKDDDCNGSVDDGCSACVPAPSGVEVCGNAKDDDCNGSIDDGCTGGCTKAPGGVEVCGNKVDDDCNGSTDETCQCVDGETAECPGKGACAGGKKTCVNGIFSPCAGGGSAAPEVCGNKVDDDCNGVVDNGCSVCFGVGTSPWEFVRDKSQKCFGKELDDTNPAVFASAVLPGGGYIPYGKPLIDFDAKSDLPDGDDWCDGGGHHGATFTYFRTFVTADDASALKSVVATWGTADDAVMVRVIDGQGKLHQNAGWNKSPVNLTGQLTAGKNAIYAIHADTNCCTRLLANFKITVNGGVLTQCK